MKIKKTYKYLAVIASMLSLAATANAAIITSFTNLDFDAGGTSVGAGGFDKSGSDIIGWTNYGTVADSGVEAVGAWWGPYQDKSAFMKSGDGASNLSTYTIQLGDIFTVDFFAKRWNAGETAAWTVTLFYDTPANVIGSYTTPGNLPFNSTQSLGWAEYTATPIVATGASVGGQLGVIFVSSGPNFANLDEVTVDVVPEPGSMALVVLGGLGLLARSRRRP